MTVAGWFAVLGGCSGGEALVAWDPGTTPPGSSPTSSTTVDADGDSIVDDGDNCVEAANPDQADADADGVGDACDGPVDLDLDGVPDNVDNCADAGNPAQADADFDGVGDACDNCADHPNPDQSDDDRDGIGNACPCDACGLADWCIEHPTIGASCRPDCIPEERQGSGGTCCPTGSRWSSDHQRCLLADIHVDADRLLGSLEIRTKDISPDSCELVEGCVNAPGRRRLLRFDTTTPNTGEGDLFMGDPRDSSGAFQYSECHQHYHMNTYADYKLLDADGNVAAPGHKQAFCLMDFEPFSPDVRRGDAIYDCGYQGISAGFADTYYSGLDCQFVDITDVPPGNYQLEVHVNFQEFLAESDYSNNVLSVPVVIPAE